MASVARAPGRSEPSIADLLARAGEERIDFVNMQFTDVMGIVKSVTMPIAELEDALTNGVWFDGSAIDGFTRIAESDMFLMPDRSTFAVIPWEKSGHSTARLICDVHKPNGDPFPGDRAGC
jgi:glutamine synthetase